MPSISQVIRERPWLPHLIIVATFIFMGLVQAVRADEGVDAAECVSAKGMFAAAVGSVNTLGPDGDPAQIEAVQTVFEKAGQSMRFECGEEEAYTYMEQLYREQKAAE